jgi:DNA sulfur modification protein DndC
MRQDGQWSRNVQRLGPLTMRARAYGLDRVLDIQQRAGVDLINPAEEARIREMWALDIWPRKWSAQDADGTQPLDAITLTLDGELAVQPRIV